MLSEHLRHPGKWGWGLCLLPVSLQKNHSATQRSEPTFPKANFLVSWAASHVILAGGCVGVGAMVGGGWRGLLSARRMGL